MTLKVKFSLKVQITEDSSIRPLNVDVDLDLDIDLDLDLDLDVDLDVDDGWTELEILLDSSG